MQELHRLSQNLPTYSWDYSSQVWEDVYKIDGDRQKWEMQLNWWLSSYLKREKRKEKRGKMSGMSLFCLVVNLPIRSILWMAKGNGLASYWDISTVVSMKTATCADRTLQIECWWGNLEGIQSCFHCSELMKEVCCVGRGRAVNEKRQYICTHWTQLAVWQLLSPNWITSLTDYYGLCCQEMV